MSEKNEVATSHRTDILERKAKVVQSRLLRAIDALDSRRHQVERIGEQAKMVAGPASLAVLGIAALFGVSAFAFSIAIKKSRRVTLGERVAVAVRKLDLSPRPTLGRRVFEKVTMTFVTMAASEVARRAIKNVVDGRLLDGRLAVGSALEVNHQKLAAPIQ